jgi:hypothetical protein
VAASLPHEDDVNHLNDESDLSADNMAHPSGMILSPDSMNKIVWPRIVNNNGNSENFHEQSGHGSFPTLWY